MYTQYILISNDLHIYMCVCVGHQPLPNWDAHPSPQPGRRQTGSSDWLQKVTLW